jgi:hypothetical protein
VASSSSEQDELLSMSEVVNSPGQEPSERIASGMCPRGKTDKLFVCFSS